MSILHRKADFDNLPDDIDISCSENGDAPEDLTYSNGESGDCAISGTVAGVRSGVIDYCGGVLTDTWEFTDECGRTITAERDVNVEPAPAAAYINPPSDVTVNCDEVDIVPGNVGIQQWRRGIVSNFGDKYCGSQRYV